MITLVFTEDNGHGWLKVPVSLLQQLQIEGEISRHSYLYKDNAYLEEDCDVPLFIEALLKVGIAYTVKHKRVARSAIRTYRDYSVQGTELMPAGTVGEHITYAKSIYIITRNLGRMGYEIMLKGGSFKYRLSNKQLNHADRYIQS